MYSVCLGYVIAIFFSSFFSTAFLDGLAKVISNFSLITSLSECDQDRSY